jgi:hypothetical protein
LGAEFLVVARRNLTIGEVVTAEVTSWFSEFGLSDGNNAIDNAAIAIGLSASVGTALRAFVLKSNPNWFKGPIEVKINKNAYAYKGTTPFTGKLMLQPRK